MADVDSLWRQFTSQTLRQAAERKLTHGKGRRLGVALHARRCAGKQNRTMTARHHALGRLLRNQKSAERADRDRFLNLGGIKRNEWTAGHRSEERRVGK